MQSLQKVILAIFSLVFLVNAKAATYNVGPGQSLTNLSSVPWGTLLPGDTVNIFCKPGGYHEIIQISQGGTANAPITIHGVPDPVTGALPSLDGSNAVMDTHVDFRNPVFEDLGVILVTPRATGYVYGQTFPSWITIDSLDLRNALYQTNGLTFTDQHGATRIYNTFACGIYIEFAQHLTIRNCEISFNGNGIFANSKNGAAQASSDLLIEKNYLHDNGQPVIPNLDNGYHEHNIYVESVGVTYQFNRFGPLRVGCHGCMIKDRSSRCVIRYNQVVSTETAEIFAILDPQGGTGYIDQFPDYPDAYVYGNDITIQSIPGGQADVVWFAAVNGASSYPTQHRGTLYFYNNTVACHQNVVSAFSVTDSVYTPTTNILEVVDCRNNIFYTDTAVNASVYNAFHFIISPAHGTLNLGTNWISPGTLPTWQNHAFGGVINGFGAQLVGDFSAQNNPGFSSLASTNNHLLATSRCIDTAGPQAPSVAMTTNAVTLEYVAPTGFQTRVISGAGMDLGTYETVGATTYSLTVSNGTGGGNYPVGVMLSITANPPASGLVFDQWTGASVSNIFAATTTLVMPASNTMVAGTYKTAPVVTNYTLTVVNGSGGGSYPQNTIVPITANPAPNGQVFKQWTGATVGNAFASSTTLVMPGSNAAVTATYIPAASNSSASSLVLADPIIFVTQPPIPRELNSTVSNTFLSVVTIFGNQQADTAHAARGGDLMLLTTNGGLVNLTRKAGFGTNGIQHGIGIDVRDPAIHWFGKKVLFSMVAGAPASSTDTNIFYWQLYELTNLDAVIANTNTPPVIVKVSNQPTNCNNVTPTYATDGRIIFMSDRAFNNQAFLYPQLDEYKGQPTVTGTYSLDPVTGDLKMIQHTPSGAFNPFVDSFGRLILTRWDHLSQDPLAADDRLGIINNGAVSMNGSLNFLSETFGSPTQSTNLLETFPEPRKFDTNGLAQFGVNGVDFNFFFPWALDQNGGNEEVLNHVGRHELQLNIPQSFTGDTNLVTFTNLASRVASGVFSANTNGIGAFFQITEDPRTNGLYWGVQAGDISPFGGTHSAGQIITLNGGAGVNPTNMVVTFITAAFTASPQNPNVLGLFRNPLPMSDGKLIATYTPVNNTLNFGYDTNNGTASLPVSQYHFRLMSLTNAVPFWTTNQFLTGGILSTSIFWSGAMLVTNVATLWELQPVEVRTRPVPNPVVSGVAPIEQQVFAEENVDLATFQADLAQRNLALVISRNVTARDAADKQQPYNLHVPGGASSIANGGKVYDITHLQFLQADFLRGYTNGPNGLPQLGRRILAMPMHATTNVNYASTKTNAPIGGTEIMSDGSQATFIPANRAVTWQFTGTNNNDSVVKERYWISFRPGEVRTCANCHGINAVDQLGRTSPTNAPFALRQLLRFWKTNSANAYSLIVSNGSGGGNFGAGSILTLTASNAPSGKFFAGWTGTGISNAALPTTLFIMPTNSTAVIAMFSNLPTPIITGIQFVGGTNFSLTASVLTNQPWILQSSSNLVAWVNVSTNFAAASGSLQLTNLFNPNSTQQFFRLKSP